MKIDGARRPLHSATCRVRWLLVTVLIVMAVTSAYDVVLLADLPPARDLVALHLAVAMVAFCAGVVCVAALSRLLSTSLGVLVGTTSGAGAAWALSVAAGVGGGEELNGLVFRMIGGAIVGAVTGVTAWAIVRFLHVRLSGSVCAVADPRRPAKSPPER